MASTYEPIATYTAPSTTSTYTFSSIPSTYTDLVVIFNGTTTAANSVYMRFNGDTTNSYSMTYLYGSGSSATSGRSTSTGSIYCYDTPTSQSMLTVNVQNYSNSTTYKTSLIRGSAAASDVTAIAGLWAKTNAITSLELYTNSTFTTGSTFTLYGIKAA
jgi:hypothetical protein